MQKRKLWILLCLCIVLFIGALLLSTLYRDDPGPEDEPQDPTAVSAVVINEIMASNRTYPGHEGKYLDYIELRNLSNVAVDLTNYKLSDNESTIGYTFPQGASIAPYGYLLLWCDSSDTTGSCLPFQLSRDGDEGVYLYNGANVLVDQRPIPEMESNISYSRDEDGQWFQAEHGSPGFVNTEEGYYQWLEAIGVTGLEVVFSEVQSANRSAVLDSQGRLCDWLELYNPGSSPAVLDGCYLSDDPADPMRWRIENLTLQPGAYHLIKCVGSGAAADEVDFALSRSGATLVLSGPVGNLITQLEVPVLQSDRSWQLQEDGTYLETEFVTPGLENTQQAYHQFRGEQTVSGPLMISEVMPANNRYMIQSDGDYYDWIELQNISAMPVELSDFCLSDSADDPYLFPLPAGVLNPGEYVVIICSGDPSLTGNYIHSSFALDYQECWVYVSHADGGYSDYVRITDVPYQGSAGRVPGENEVHYFPTPTPGNENGPGAPSISADPFVQTPGGVYNGVENVSVVLSGEGQIRYTTDGSVPTEASTLYTGPLILTETTAIRAVSFEEGKLPSDVVTVSYIINENHTMPVLSLTADPDAMFGSQGIYTQYTKNWEIPCNLTLYDEDGGFDVNCGVKMHGHTGLQNPKKSFKINFRGVYGSDVLSYPIYGEEGSQLFDSLCIRAGQDYLFAVFREELFVSLCQDMGDHVLTQDSRYCILYINGEYWGVYNLKEAFSEMYYAQKRGVSEESVEMIQAPVYASSDVYKLMRYLETHDMTKEENYEYVCSVVDIDSLIDWMIIQGYSTNGDIQQNLRYFRSTENGNKLEFALYDLDWAFYYHLAFTDVLSNGREMSWQHLRITMNIIKNPEFRQKFLERLSYHMENTLSVENVLARIDYFEQLLDPEMRRERERWYGSYSVWKNSYVQRLRNFITEYDHMGDIVSRLRRYIGLTRQEIDKYFWRWA